jgi:hypothetical protein
MADEAEQDHTESRSAERSRRGKRGRRDRDADHLPTLPPGAPVRDRWLFNLSAAGVAYCLWLAIAFVDARLLLEIGVIAWAARIARERRLDRGDDGREHEDWLDY